MPPPLLIVLLSLTFICIVILVISIYIDNDGGTIFASLCLFMLAIFGYGLLGVSVSTKTETTVIARSEYDVAVTDSRAFITYDDYTLSTNEIYFYNSIVDSLYDNFEVKLDTHYNMYGSVAYTIFDIYKK